ncbi:helix-turn-helix transcriptional regulator [Ferrimonas marina]|uniref:DNA-binding response regulator, NarL/FixJ family, contains REC and HTH domains n=1 Tax=Ferrimonas marina TaxID=299255 RepID=A0A1M5VQ18_9GAMM|nr:response regulator transcription factor [Ferrimonas marina]SHH77327.1 DNA-binding response regulator, NarL/FixJ family, contains REC and HTH domains [Ferrimonas marina]
MDSLQLTLCFWRSEDSLSLLPQLCNAQGNLVESTQCNKELRLFARHYPDSLLLIDHERNAGEAKLLPHWLLELAERHKVAIYNTPESHRLASTLLTNGFQGVIQQSQRPETQLLAIRTMHQGSLWFSREVLEQTCGELLMERKNNLAHCKAKDALNQLTQREQLVYSFVAAGLSNKAIAKQLGISEYTVKAHLSSAYRKTQTQSRAELVGKLS